MSCQRGSACARGSHAARRWGMSRRRCAAAMPLLPACWRLRPLPRARARAVGCVGVVGMRARRACIVRTGTRTHARSRAAQPRPACPQAERAQRLQAAKQAPPPRAARAPAKRRRVAGSDDEDDDEEKEEEDGLPDEEEEFEDSGGCGGAWGGVRGAGGGWRAAVGWGGAGCGMGLCWVAWSVLPFVASCACCVRALRCACLLRRRQQRRGQQWE